MFSLFVVRNGLFAWLFLNIDRLLIFQLLEERSKDGIVIIVGVLVVVVVAVVVAAGTLRAGRWAGRVVDNLSFSVFGNFSSNWLGLVNYSLDSDW